MRAGPWVVELGEDSRVKLDCRDNEIKGHQVWLTVEMGESVSMNPMTIAQFEELIRDALEIRAIHTK